MNKYGYRFVIQPPIFCVEVGQLVCACARIFTVINVKCSGYPGVHMDRFMNMTYIVIPLTYSASTVCTIIGLYHMLVQGETE